MPAAERSALRRCLLALLLLAVLAAQTIAFMHQALHGRQLAWPDAAAELVQEAERGEAEAQGLAALFSGHDDEARCRLVDSLTHAAPDVAVLATAALPLAATTLSSLAGAALARWAALFDARGPPLVR